MKYTRLAVNTCLKGKGHPKVVRPYIAEGFGWGRALARVDIGGRHSRNSIGSTLRGSELASRSTLTRSIQTRSPPSPAPGPGRQEDLSDVFRTFAVKEGSVRYTALTSIVIVLVFSVPANAQQGGPVASVGDETSASSSSDSIFPLYKSLLQGRNFLPPYGINLVLFDLSGQWDVKSFSASVERESARLREWHGERPPIHVRTPCRRLGLPLHERIRHRGRVEAQRTGDRL